MINRNEVEKILKINGVEPTSPDEQIRSVLLSARFDKDEVDAALMVLRENMSTKQTRIDGLHKVFRSSEALRPIEISQLLGIDVEVTDSFDSPKERRALSAWQVIVVWTLAFFISIAGLMVYMYFQKIGLFHPSVELTFLQ